MALAAPALASQLIAAMKGINNANAAITTFGNTIISYLTSSMQITYAWAGVNPTGMPDPVVTVMGTASGSGSFRTPANLPDLCAQIATAIKGLTITLMDPTFSVAPLMFNPGGTVTIVMAQENTFEAAMTSVATQVIASIPTFVAATPAAGSHAAFTGAATMVSIL